MSTVPSDAELKDALVVIKRENPTLGIPKIHALLRSTYPDWSVSDKRTRKVLQNEGLISGPSAGIIYPSSRITKSLDVTKLCPKAEVHFFDKRKGKGLRASQPISRGEVLWKEDPWALASDQEIREFQRKSAACEHCSTPFQSDHTMTVTCPSSSASSHCSARFCNRLCLSRAAKIHPLLCPATNPASIQVIEYSMKAKWKAVYALCQCTARVLLAYQTGGDVFASDWDIFQSFASLGMEERYKNVSAKPDIEAWKTVHGYYVEAFLTPKSSQHIKALHKILKKPLNTQIEKALFDYESFSANLGRMSLNLEAHGGLYSLHSHMNHACTPNISVRHLDQRTALSKITIIATRDITPGEELVITYVNPSLDVKEREKQLFEWGFGTCDCKRCVEERKTYVAPLVPVAHREEGGEGGAGGVSVVDLEKELKESLGVF